MCQVSTTLYNAALGVSNIKITERHPHGKAVNYVHPSSCNMHAKGTTVQGWRVLTKLAQHSCLFDTNV